MNGLIRERHERAFNLKERVSCEFNVYLVSLVSMTHGLPSGSVDGARKGLDDSMVCLKLMYVVSSVGRSGIEPCYVGWNLKLVYGCEKKRKRPYGVVTGNAKTPLVISMT